MQKIYLGIIGIGYIIGGYRYAKQAYKNAKLGMRIIYHNDKLYFGSWLTLLYCWIVWPFYIINDMFLKCNTRYYTKRFMKEMDLTEEES